MTLINSKYQNTIVTSVTKELPRIKWEIEFCMKKTSDELKRIGFDMPNEARDKQSVLMEKVSEFCKLMRCSSRGDYRDGYLSENANTRLHTHIQHCFKTMQDNIFLARPSGIANVQMMEQLQKEMQSQRGRELPGFLSSQVFYSQIVNHVEQWRIHMDTCLNETVILIRRIISQLIHVIAPQFPRIVEAIVILINTAVS